MITKYRIKIEKKQIPKKTENQAGTLTTQINRKVI